MTHTTTVTLESLGAPPVSALPRNDTARLALLKIAANVAGGPVALDSQPTAFPVVFQGISYACPRLALFGFATERQCRNAVARKLAKRGCV